MPSTGRGQSIPEIADKYQSDELDGLLDQSTLHLQNDACAHLQRVSYVPELIE